MEIYIAVLPEYGGFIIARPGHEARFQQKCPISTIAAWESTQQTGSTVTVKMVRANGIEKRLTQDRVGHDTVFDLDELAWRTKVPQTELEDAIASFRQATQRTPRGLKAQASK
jgi:hypothetical protein